MIMDKIKERAISRSPFCVGIDLRMDHVPAELQNSFTKTSDKLVAYAKEAIDASKEYAACYKVQIACYEAEGLDGMVAYQQIVSYIRSIGEIVIADVKRGDIGSTAGLYAKGHLSGDFEADVVTLSPYMGKDAISPYFDFFAKDKGAFVLAKTSNEGSKDFQDLIIDGQPLYMSVLQKLKEWSKEIPGDYKFSPLGAVVGVNELKDIKALKENSKDTYLLIPGYGAQGANIEAIRALIQENKNGVINVSRGYTAGIKESDFRKVLSQRAQQLAKELSECIK